MKDLTPLQAVKQLRKLFPTKTCYVQYECFSYKHLEPLKEEAPNKKIYVEDIPSLCHIKGNSFKNLLKIAATVKGDLNVSS